MTELETIQKIIAWQISQAIGYENEEMAMEHAALFTVDFDNNFSKALMIGSKYRENANREHWTVGDPWDEVVAGLLREFVMDQYRDVVSLFFSEKEARKKFEEKQAFDSCDYLALFEAKDGGTETKWVHSVQYLYCEEGHLKSSYWVIEADAFQRNQNALRYVAEHDQLTGLYNRHKMTELSSRREPAIYILLDINDFKSINDTYGHMAGDDALRALAGRLEEIFHRKQCDLIFRIGGDEFLVVLTDADEKRAIDGMERLSKPIPVGGEFEISVSIGYAKGNEYKEAFAQADKALYYVKEHGKSGFQRVGLRPSQ